MGTRHTHYKKRGTCEQWIKEGKGAIKWTRLSCRTFAANAVRLQVHALAYNLGNFLRTLATPEPIKHWSLTTLKDKLIKIGAKVVRYVIFQMAEVAGAGPITASSQNTLSSAVFDASVNQLTHELEKARYNRSRGCNGRRICIAGREHARQ
jgi:Transposase DDE domain group 1